MADLKSARSNARNKATSTAAETKASEKKGRAPKPRSEEGTDAAEEVEAESTEPSPLDLPLIVVASNPKRPGTASHGFYEKYKVPTEGKHGVLTTQRAVREAGVRGKDVSWDLERRHILMDDPSAKNEEHRQLATDFAAITDRNEQAAFLKGLGVQDKNLIKWGYMDEPKQEEPAAEETAEKTEEKADA